MEKSFKIENLSIKIYGQTMEMGAAAADYVTSKLNDAIVEKGEANLILATGASQFSFLEAMQTRKIDWGKITVFHLDEYKGISESHPASFRKYLKERILNRVAPKKIYFLNGDAANLQLEINNYEEALKAHPIDIACIGIGENGHIAFNDPAVADFNDPKLVKVVELDEACRNQQLGEGWFPSFADVPKEAVTLTITAIMNCKAISCVVPDQRKAQAVYNSLYGDISTSCPASILRTHPETVLFLDRASASMIK
jgi:glucosamine-6-phosphate deaminase|tara:strand:- start:430 stop:1191 length:762 start_codon:yes stop_codon:yes gene_type:complete